MSTASTQTFVSPQTDSPKIATTFEIFAMVKSETTRIETSLAETRKKRAIRREAEAAAALAEFMALADAD
ncbi:hypothetical protein [Stieleria varia]|uniref:Uncharacterized protein n=1 Tax=Stieleria varia TaxID=2528005 RepID=A0A5C5ZPY5_9BACT|nr:hypothetical protein [Stieleria varia]TWT89158.1 hypothetical protein Pla52n_68910 [Stieleria varia]